MNLVLQNAEIAKANIILVLNIRQILLHRKEFTLKSMFSILKILIALFQSFLEMPVIYKGPIEIFLEGQLMGNILHLLTQTLFLFGSLL